MPTARPTCTANRIGIVFQSFHLLPSLSALDDAALPLQMAGVADTRAGHGDARARMALRGSCTAASRRCRAASSSAWPSLARLYAGRACCSPTSPPATSTTTPPRPCAKLLFSLNRDFGTTLVLVTHDLDFAARCDRVLRLHDGQLHDAKPHESPTRDALPA
jgi:putative ABC transport system ATP-binding protein